MTARSMHLLLALLIGLLVMPVSARDGDTLQPIQIESPALETVPDDFLAESDFNAIQGRVMEARASGAPVAVRVVDLTLESSDLPFAVRKYATADFSQPLPGDAQEEILTAWTRSDPVETSDNADDGFLLLVLVPEDRTQTQALWWIGDDALPLNGLTEENIRATQLVMNQQFDANNIPNGVFLGISEFSYNVQFGVPHRRERTQMGQALHTAVVPLAIGTMIAGMAVPLLAWWLARKNNYAEEIHVTLTPWQAAALHLKRPTGAISTAMLLDAVHRGVLTPARNGSLRFQPDGTRIRLHAETNTIGSRSLEPGTTHLVTTALQPAPEEHTSALIQAYRTDAAVTALQPFLAANDMVPAPAVREMEALTASIQPAIEDELAAIGAFTPRARVDRAWMLLTMAVAAFSAVLSIVPTVVSMSRLGVLAIAVALIGILSGWWWLKHRTYTSPAGARLLQRWLSEAPAEERHLFDTAVHLDLLTDQVGGPNVPAQRQVVRSLRGFGAS